MIGNFVALKANNDAAPIGIDAKERFLNRELSWLEFNARVLEEAGNQDYPLLERIRFLSISASNLDEFFMVRIAGLKGQVDAGFAGMSPDGLTPAGQLQRVRARASQLMTDQQETWATLKSELGGAGIHIASKDALGPEELKWLKTYFNEQVFSLLTPVAVDPAHPFPFIPNLGFSMALQLRSKKDGQILKALIPLPNIMDRFIQIPVPDDRSVRLILLEDVIVLFLSELFPDFEVEESACFRIIRDSEVELDEEAEDLMRTYQSALKRRSHGSVIHLSVDAKFTGGLYAVVVEESRVSSDAVIRSAEIVGLADTAELCKLDRPDLMFDPFNARFPERVRELGGDCFEAIRQKDFIVHHPYESFDVVVQFIRQAARDPDVVAVKQTLYRTSNDSPTVAALIEAAEAGKSVTAMVELKARFDEEANIRWARDLERAGANVVFGFLDKKTHAKISLVVRREGAKLRSYAHFGTGNYHPVTAKIYTDLSFFTCDPKLCHDAAQIFNFMTGYTEPTNLEKLSVSPLTLRETLFEMIEAEIAHAVAGRSATIWVKMNALVDPGIIDALYLASGAGVQIELIIRGICCLRPGVPGLSENIRVKSIVGRFLEHSRIVVFGNGAELPSHSAKVFISSADWMPRNLNWRVEVMVPIENSTVHQQVLEQVMGAVLLDGRRSWIMNADGTYSRPTRGNGDFNAHEFFMTNPSLSGRGSALEHHRPATPHLVSDRS
ncbi:MAG: RNA degradosome polyphosphate kinase [Rhodospirillaceae bacterium]|mgnify:FL=1|nr:RNA degradosome polyphosphate kinase [Rhodospirillaceae bacterium]